MECQDTVRYSLDHGNIISSVMVGVPVCIMGLA